MTSEECNRRNILLVELAGSTFKKAGNKGRLCGMRLTHVFPRSSFWSGIGKLQVCKHSSNRMVSVQFGEGFVEHFLSEQKEKA